jgi:hypothetical protein
MARRRIPDPGAVPETATSGYTNDELADLSAQKRDTYLRLETIDLLRTQLDGCQSELTQANSKLQEVLKQNIDLSVSKAHLTELAASSLCGCLTTGIGAIISGVWSKDEAAAIWGVGIALQGVGVLIVILQRLIVYLWHLASGETPKTQGGKLQSSGSKREELDPTSQVGVEH